MASKLRSAKKTQSNEDGEKENIPKKGDNSAKGYEFDSSMIDNRISAAIQDLSINNKIDTATKEFKSKIDSSFISLLNNFKSNINQICSDTQRDFQTKIKNVANIVEKEILSVSSQCTVSVNNLCNDIFYLTTALES